MLRVRGLREPRPRQEAQDLALPRLLRRREGGVPKGANPGDYVHSYNKTSDATLGTLIHEASHGTWDAADAPIPLDNGSWNPGAPDANGDSPNNDIQASTRVLDKKLATMHPTIAIQNADNYGQFACEVAIAKKK